jgi:hypothetical protein
VLGGNEEGRGGQERCGGRGPVGGNELGAAGGQADDEMRGASADEFTDDGKLLAAQGVIGSGDADPLEVSTTQLGILLVGVR